MPEAVDREVVGKLLSWGWEQEYDTAAELYTHSLFEDLQGLRFEYHPEFQGKVPDFALWTQFEHRVLADVKVLHNGPITYAEKEQEDYVLLRQKAQGIETDHFGVEVLWVRGSRSKSGGPVALQRILRRVREAADEIEQTYRKVKALPTWGPEFKDRLRRITSSLAFPELGINLELNVALYLKEDETDEHRTLRRLQREGRIGVASVWNGDSVNRLTSALSEKASYLTGIRRPESDNDRLPYIVVIFDTDPYSIDEVDMQNALYGASVGYDLQPLSLNQDLYQWEQRNAFGSAISYREGLFTSRKSDFLAVLHCAGDIRLPSACEMSMWINPYASIFQIPQSLFRLKTYSLRSRIDCTSPVPVGVGVGRGVR